MKGCAIAPTQSSRPHENETVYSLSCVQLFATPWTIAHQTPLSVEFSRQEYWSVLPFPSPGDLPDLGIEPRTPALQADSLLAFHQGHPHPYPIPKLNFSEGFG